MNFQDLLAHEKLALAALVRTLIRMDGTFSEEEEDHVHVVAKQLGDSKGFFAAVEEAEQKVTTPDALKAATLAVTRSEVRQLILDVLIGVGAAEAAVQPEAKMLAELRSIWGLPEND